MWKLSKYSSIFWYYYLNHLFTYTFSFYPFAYQKLLISLSAKYIYRYFLEVAICIKEIKLQIYYSEKNGIFLRKIPIYQTINVENIHIPTDLITIHRGKNFILCA